MADVKLVLDPDRPRDVLQVCCDDCERSLAWYAIPVSADSMIDLAASVLHRCEGLPATEYRVEYPDESVLLRVES